MITEQGIVSAIARCMDCEWEEERLNKARNRGYYHAKKYNHHVCYSKEVSSHYRGDLNE